MEPEAFFNSQKCVYKGSKTLQHTPLWGFFMKGQRKKVKRLGIVKKTLTNKAWVQILEDSPVEDVSTQASCSCSTCAGCHTQKDHCLVDLDLPVKEGDKVELFLETHKLYITAFIAFALPVIALIVGLWVTRSFENSINKWGLVGLFLAISFFIAYIFDKQNKAKVKIIKVWEKEKEHE